MEIIKIVQDGIELDVMGSVDTKLTKVENDLTAHKLDYVDNRNQDQLKVAKVEKELNDYKSTLSQVNLNQEAKQKVTGYGTVSLPKNSANGQVGVSVEGKSNNQIEPNGRALCNNIASFDGVSTTNPIITQNADNIEVAISAGQTYATLRWTIANYIQPNEYYFIKADVELLTGVNLTLAMNNSSVKTAEITTAGRKSIYIKYQCANDISGSSGFTQFIFSGVEGDKFRVYKISQYKITADEFSNKTADQLNQEYEFQPYGTKSTISASRLKSVGKNIWGSKKAADDIIKIINNTNIAFISTVDGRNTLAVKGNSGLLNKPLFNRFKSNTQYVLQFFGRNNGSNGGYFSIVYVDGTTESLHLPSAWKKTNHITTQGKTVESIMFNYSSSTGYNYIDYDTLMLSEGTTIYPYEPYTESTQYLPNIGELRSLPNGVSDEIRVSGGKAEHIQRNKEKVLQASDINGMVTLAANVERVVTSNTFIPDADKQGWSNSTTTSKLSIEGWKEKPYADSLDSVGTFYTSSTGALTFLFAKGTTLEQAKQQLEGTVLTYQLAEPIITPIQTSGNLVSYPSGTIYVEPVTNVAGIYKDKVSVLATELPIQSIDKISKIDFTTGNETLLDVSKVVIASDKLSFTHPNLTSGDIVFFEYYYPQEITTIGNIEVEYLDSRYTLKDSVTSKFYKWEISVANGIPSINLVEVL